MPDGELVGVLFGLVHAFGNFLAFRIGFDYSQPLVAVFQHLIGDQRLDSPAFALQTAQTNGEFSPHACALDHASSRAPQHGIDQLSSRLSFAHRLRLTYRLPAKA